MKAIILAAGYATRLAATARGTPEEDALVDMPKALVRVGDRPLFKYLMDQLSGVDMDIIIVTNSKYYPIFNEWLHNNNYKAELIDNGTTTNETKLGAVKDFELGYGKSKGDVFLAASDVLLPAFSFPDFYTAFQNKGDCILASKMEISKIRGRYGNLKLDASNKVTDFIEKPEAPISNIVSVPYYMLREETAKKISTYLKEGNHPDPIGKFFGWLIHKQPVYCEVISGPYFDVGTYEDWKAANGWMTRHGRVSK